MTETQDNAGRKKAKVLKGRFGHMVPSGHRHGLPPETATDPHRLAGRYLRREAHDEVGRLTLRWWRGEWWTYEDGHYSKVLPETVRNDVLATIKWIFDHEPVVDEKGRVYRVTQGTVTNTVRAMESIVEVPESIEQPAWIGKGKQRRYFAMENELVDRDELLTGRVAQKPHTPEWFSQVKFPYPFEKGARCPRWETFLAEVLENDQERIALLQEFFGYCLVHDTSQHKFVVLEGEGANGKSVALEILTHLVGPANVSNVPLEAFSGRFQLASTLGKLVNVATEVGDMDRPSEAVLKQFTAGDRMHFDRKHITPIEAYPTARLVFAANNRPKFSDGSGGLWRRMILIPFRVVIPPDRQDKQLVEKLKRELPGIFNWAIEGLRRLYRQGGFTSPAICEEAAADYRLESNPARVFLTEHCSPQPLAMVGCGAIYAYYADWCKANGYVPLNSRQFGKEVKRAYPEVSRVKQKVPAGRVYVYRGLAHDPMGLMTHNSPENVKEEIESK